MNKEYKWENLTISNDFVFAKMMSDKELCKELIENLLHIKVNNLNYIQEQKTIDVIYSSKSIRLDVYVEDENKIYNIEMQISNNKNLAKRTRYYQDLIDLNTIEKGEDYRDLKESYIIFICTFDLFNKGLPRYTFENICNEDNSIKLEDKTYKIFLNSKAFEKEEDENIKSFLMYLNGEKSNNSFINKLDEKLKDIKSNKEWRREYMTFEMKLKEIAEENFEDGLEQGMIKQIKALKSFDIPDEKIIAKIIEDYYVSQDVVKKYL